MDNNNKWYSIPDKQPEPISFALNEEHERSLDVIETTDLFVDEGKVYTKITEVSIVDKRLIIKFSNGLTFDCGVVKGESPILRYKPNVGVEMKFENEPDTKYKLLIPIGDINLTYEKLTPTQKEELKMKYTDMTPAQKNELATSVGKYMSQNMSVNSNGHLIFNA